MEKALLVTYDLRSVHSEKHKREAEEIAMKDVNEHLNNGWKVKQISAMSGTDSYFSTAIVVLGKD